MRGPEGRVSHISRPRSYLYCTPCTRHHQSGPATPRPCSEGPWPTFSTLQGTLASSHSALPPSHQAGSRQPLRPRPLPCSCLSPRPTLGRLRTPRALDVPSAAPTAQSLGAALASPSPSLVVSPLPQPLALQLPPPSPVWELTSSTWP